MPPLPAGGSMQVCPGSRTLSNIVINWQFPSPWGPTFKRYFSISIIRLGEKAINTTCNIAVLPRSDSQVGNSHSPATLCFQSQTSSQFLVLCLLSAQIPVLPFMTQLHSFFYACSFMPVTACSIQFNLWQWLCSCQSPVQEFITRLSRQPAISCKHLRAIQKGLSLYLVLSQKASRLLPCKAGAANRESQRELTKLTNQSEGETPLMTGQQEQQAFTGSKQTPQGK